MMESPTTPSGNPASRQAGPVDMSEVAHFAPDKHFLQFTCEWAVFPNNGWGSVCYTTSEERAQWISDCLNTLKKICQICADNWDDKNLPLYVGEISDLAHHPEAIRDYAQSVPQIPNENHKANVTLGGP